MKARGERISEAVPQHFVSLMPASDGWRRHWRPGRLVLRRFCTMTDIHALLTLMVSKGASDLFLTHNAPPHIKIEGVTHSVNVPPFKPGEVKQLAHSIMTDRQTA